MSFLEDNRIHDKYLKWVIGFYVGFTISYTFNTYFIYQSEEIGFTIYTRLFCIFYVVYWLIYSLIDETEHQKLYYRSYLLSYVLMFNSFYIPFINPGEFFPVFYFGASSILISYIYLSLKHMSVYLILQNVMVFILMYQSYFDEPIKVALGSLLNLVFSLYIVAFFMMKRKTDYEELNRLESMEVHLGRKSDSLSSVESIKLMYEDLLENSPYMIAMMDLNHQYYYINNATLLNDQMQKWLIGKTDRDYFNKIGVPEDYADIRIMAVNQCIKLKETVIVKEDFSECNMKIPFSNGIRRYVPIFGKNGEIKNVAIYS